MRLYELVDELSTARAEDREIVEMFHRGLERFEDKDWKGAQKLFQEVLRLRPEDGPAVTFSKRCEEFLVRPPVSTWDGVYNMDRK